VSNDGSASEGSVRDGVGDSPLGCPASKSRPSTTNGNDWDSLLARGDSVPNLGQAKALFALEVLPGLIVVLEREDADVRVGLGRAVDAVDSLALIVNGGNGLVVRRSTCGPASPE